MEYNKVGWENEPSRTTPINASNLDHMDEGIKQLVDEVNSIGEDLGDAESDIAGLSTRMGNAEGNISSIGTTLASTTSRVSTAESNIANLSSAMGTANSNITNLQGRMTTAESDIDTLEGRVNNVASATNYRVYEMVMGSTSTGMIELAIDNWTVGGAIASYYPIQIILQSNDSRSAVVSLLIKNDGTIMAANIEETYKVVDSITYTMRSGVLSVSVAFVDANEPYKVYVKAPVFMTIGMIGSPQVQSNALSVSYKLNWADIMGITNSSNMHSVKIASNITGNGRLMLHVSEWVDTRAEMVLRFVNRSTGGYIDVNMLLKQNDFPIFCRAINNGGITISNVYKSTDNLTYDFKITDSTQYDVYATMPIWIDGGYFANTTASGSEITISRFDYMYPSQIDSKIGDLSNLQTTTKSNVVGAINEVNSKIVDTDYVISEYTLDGVTQSSRAFRIVSNAVSEVSDNEYLLEVEIELENGYCAKIPFTTTDDGVKHSSVFIFYTMPRLAERTFVEKIQDASQTTSANDVQIWFTISNRNPVKVRLKHHKSKTYIVENAPSLPSGVGVEIEIISGTSEIHGVHQGSGSLSSRMSYVSTFDGAVSIVSGSNTEDIFIYNEGKQGDSETSGIRIFTPNGDVRINNNFVGKNSLSNMGDGTITGAIAFSNEDGEEVSGNPITITDAIDANAVDVSVDIEPVQEGSGTPSPTNIRPIHAVTESKNLYDKANVLDAYIADTTGEIIASSTGSKTAFVKVKAGVYTISKITSSVFRFARYSSQPTVGSQCISGSKFNVSSDATKYTYTISEDCWVGMFFVNGSSSSDVANSQAIIDSIQVEKGSTETPYTSHEPQIEIKRVGKNLFDKDSVTMSVYLKTDGSVVESQTWDISDYIPVVENEKITKSGTVEIGTNPSSCFYDENKNYISGIRISSTTQTLTVPSGARYFRTTVAKAEKSALMIERGDTATTYEPYQGETYIIKTGENVYGAHHDATTGKMVVTHGFAELGELTWTATSTTSVFYSAALINSVNKQTMNAICSKYPCYKGSSQSGMEDKSVFVRSDGVVFIKDTSYTDVTTFKNSLSDAQLVYDLATPQTINLTPQQVKMLKGTNTVSSNAQTINLSYLKDNAVGRAVSIVEKEIEPQIEEIHNEINTKMNSDSIAPVENGATASTSYAVGNYITRNNNLYKVISAISQGATFTSNNIQPTTVTDIIKHKTVYYTNNIQTNDIYIPLFSSSEANRKGIVSVMLLDAYSMIPAYASVTAQVEYVGGGSSSTSALINYHLKIASGQGSFGTGSYSVEVFYVEF